MTSPEPVTQLIKDLKLGDADAARRLWELYNGRVAAIARTKLPFAADVAHVSSIVQSVFRTVFIRARDAKFPQLEDRDNLQAILYRIAVRKTYKRGAYILKAPKQADLEQIVSNIPDHEIETDLQDVVQNVMNQIDADSQQVFERLLNTGQTNDQIARHCGFSLAKVERKRRIIREMMLEQLR